MDVSAGLIAKGTAGALTASAAVGGGVWAGTNGMFDGLFRSNAVENEGVAKPVFEAQSGTDSHQESQNQDPGTEESPVTSEGNPSEGEDTQRESGTSGGLTGSKLEQTREGSDSISESGQSTNDLLQTSQQPVVSIDGEQKTTITKWDKALVSYLRKEEKTDWDIEFNIKTGNKANVELSNSFPNFEDSTRQQTESSSEQKSTVTITVSVSTTNLKGTDSNEEIEKIKKMNGGDEAAKDWTWECSIVLSKAKEDGDSLPFENKDKLIGNDGYFNRLKKLVSEEDDDTNKKNLKELKAKFIENCAKHRKESKADEYKSKTSLPNNEKISARKTFELLKSADGTKWEAKTKREFNAWFIKTSTQAQ